jgi:WD repeat-containing protein 48
MLIVIDQASSSYYPRKMGSQKQSIYSIAINSTGSVLASGSSDKFIRVFDPRSGKRSFKLRGHQDNIRSVITNDDGNIVRFCFLEFSFSACICK